MLKPYVNIISKTFSSNKLQNPLVNIIQNPLVLYMVKPFMFH